MGLVKCINLPGGVEEQYPLVNVGSLAEASSIKEMEFLLGVLQNYSQNATNTHMNK
jgi:hypothetical protein